MKRIAFCIVLACFSIAIAVAESKPRITLGTVENLPPFTYYEDNKLVGIDIDVIMEIGKLAGIEMSIIPLPWARVINELQSGKIDGAFSVYEVESRKDFCVYLGIMHYDNLGFCVRKGYEFEYHSVSDLYNKVIGKGNGVYI